MRTSMALLIAFVAAAVIVSSIGVLLEVVSEATAPLAAKTQVEPGKRIYNGQCLSCHAQDGSGDRARGKVLKVPDLRTAEVQEKTDKQLFDAIVKSVVHRGLRKQIGDRDIRLAVMHVRTLKTIKQE